LLPENHLQQFKKYSPAGYPFSREFSLCISDALYPPDPNGQMQVNTLKDSMESCRKIRQATPAGGVKWLGNGKRDVQFSSLKEIASRPGLGALDCRHNHCKKMSMRSNVSRARGQNWWFGRVKSAWANPRLIVHVLH
jgi:hypothetical protein